MAGRVPDPVPIGTCHECGGPFWSVVSETLPMEEYADGSVGPPDDPRRLPQRPARRLVPGPTLVTYDPCGHTPPTGSAR